MRHAGRDINRMSLSGGGRSRGGRDRAARRRAVPAALIRVLADPAADYGWAKPVARFGLRSIHLAANRRGRIEIYASLIAGGIPHDRRAGQITAGELAGRRQRAVSSSSRSRTRKPTSVECLRHVRWAEQTGRRRFASTGPDRVVAESLRAEVYSSLLQDGCQEKKLARSNHPLDTSGADRGCWTITHYGGLGAEIAAVVEGPMSSGRRLCRWLFPQPRFMFMGRWISIAATTRRWNLRLFKHRLGRYERIGSLGDTGSGDNEVHEHVVLTTGVAVISRTISCTTPTRTWRPGRKAQPLHDLGGARDAGRRCGRREKRRHSWADRTGAWLRRPPKIYHFVRGCGFFTAMCLRRNPRRLPGTACAGCWRGTNFMSSASITR